MKQHPLALFLIVLALVLLSLAVAVWSSVGVIGPEDVRAGFRALYDLLKAALIGAIAVGVLRAVLAYLALRPPTPRENVQVHRPHTTQPEPRPSSRVTV